MSRMAYAVDRRCRRATDAPLPVALIRRDVPVPRYIPGGLPAGAIAGTAEEPRHALRLHLGVATSALVAALRGGRRAARARQYGLLQEQAEASGTCSSWEVSAERGAVRDVMVSALSRLSHRHVLSAARSPFHAQIVVSWCRRDQSGLSCTGDRTSWFLRSLSRLTHQFVTLARGGDGRRLYRRSAFSPMPQ
jgi:hypothetical protein